ncbi:unnamed protein product [Rotaria sp. Silwood1]|nr:unnamed protein product [Rotaria sp. Silwood1]CAF3465070.1 unnamed protein product [Rotaria sp. Silwood1]CAF3512581.1 unnamed protein product [Rotaria sp. Silwood1]CAF4523793.1 unnamed protein product [Rotaria sp. Silwood1]CAF4618149.1 unnamed protein product [Rotaria sp. Silwood1]
MESSPDNSKLSFIKRHHVILKTHYFLFFSAFGVVFPILNLTLRSHGLSNTEISISNTVLKFLIFLTNPLMGFIADKSRRVLLTFNSLLVIYSIAFTILFLLPNIKSHHIQADLHDLKHSQYVLDFCASQEVVTKCSSRSACGCSYQAYCHRENVSFNFTFTMNSYNVQKRLKDTLNSKCGIEYRVPIDEVLLKNISDFQHSSTIKCEITCSISFFCHGIRYEKQMIYIAVYAILYIVGYSLLAAANAMGASIGFASLPRADLFGKQRVWGTIGFGIIALTTSRIYELFHSEYVYVIMFNLITLLTIIATSFVTIRKNEKKNNEKKQKLNFSTLLLLLKNIDVIIFLSITFLWGMCYGCLHPYMALYVDEIAPCQSRSIIGSMFFIASISEVIAFYCAKRVINFFGANISSIIIFLAFSIRFGGYYFIPNPYFYLPLETTHFFCFGILYVLIAQKADLIAPAGLSSTLQGIAHGIIHGLGCGIGLLVSSYIYIAIQQRLLFLVFSILNIIAAIFYSIYFLLTYNKSAIKTVAVTNNNEIVIEEDTNLNQEPLPSLPMMAANNTENKQ